MGKCLITRRSGGSAQNLTLPVLDNSYPQDVEIWGGEENATFKVEFTRGGSLDVAYKWYKDGEVVSTDTVYTEIAPTDYGTHSIQCVITTTAGAVASRIATLITKNPNFTYTYPGLIQKAEQDNLYYVLSSGNLVITSYGKNTDGLFDLFLLGGGAGGTLYGIGGGGQYTTLTNQKLALNTPYLVLVGGGGAGGSESNVGGAGGATTALGASAAGGTAGTKANATVNCQCVSYNGTAGNVYEYTLSNGVFTSRTSLGDGYKNLSLKYPITQLTSTYNGASITCYQGAQNRVYYYCAINSIGDVSYSGTISAGSGGETTNLFGDSSLLSVSGPGVIGSNEPLRYGQGGNDVNLDGANGLLALRFTAEE